MTFLTFSPTASGPWVDYGSRRWSDRVGSKGQTTGEAAGWHCRSRNGAPSESRRSAPSTAERRTITTRGSRESLAHWVEWGSSWRWFVGPRSLSSRRGGVWREDCRTWHSSRRSRWIRSAWMTRCAPCGWRRRHTRSCTGTCSLMTRWNTAPATDTHRDVDTIQDAVLDILIPESKPTGPRTASLTGAFSTKRTQSDTDIDGTLI